MVAAALPMVIAWAPTLDYTRLLMTTRLLAGLALAAVLGGSLGACAPISGDVPDDGVVDTDEADLGSSQRSYVTLRRDYRKCSWPMCGGWYVADVNRKNTKEVYVAELDFEGSGLDAAVADQVTSAANGEVVLHGKLADLADWDDPAMKVFRVSAAWRGMPGQVVAAGDVFHEVAAVDPPRQCFTAPCPNLEVTPLHRSQGVEIDRVATQHFLEPRLDHTWLQDRVATGRAIVAGSVIDGESFPGGVEQVLHASQVFVSLPETSETECPQSKPSCDWEGGEAAVYTRDADRCVVLVGCVEGGACGQPVPECAPGYTLVSWTGGMFACTVYACDPAFLVPEPAPEPAPEG